MYFAEKIPFEKKKKKPGLEKPVFKRPSDPE